MSTDLLHFAAGMLVGALLTLALLTAALLVREAAADRRTEAAYRARARHL